MGNADKSCCRHDLSAPNDCLDSTVSPFPASARSVPGLHPAYTISPPSGHFATPCPLFLKKKKIPKCSRGAFSILYGSQLKRNHIRKISPACHRAFPCRSQERRHTLDTVRQGSFRPSDRPPFVQAERTVVDKVSGP